MCLSLSKGRNNPAAFPSHVPLLVFISTRHPRVRFNYALFFLFYFYFKRWHEPAGSIHLLTSLFWLFLFVCFCVFFIISFLTSSRVPKVVVFTPLLCRDRISLAVGLGWYGFHLCFLYAVLCVRCCSLLTPPHLLFAGCLCPQEAFALST